jgi:hypothetical protein
LTFDYEQPETKAEDQRPKSKPNKKPATGSGSGFVEIVMRWFSSACQRRKQVQQPATDVVVMPKPCVAVTVVPKHCEGLIPD